jgi:RNA exonuclease NGL2
MSELVINLKKPSNLEELKRLKLAKKEAKKKQNTKTQVQQIPPKVLERQFEKVPNAQLLENKAGQVRVMTFNVSYSGLLLLPTILLSF